MKIIFFDDFRLGVLSGDQVVDVADKWTDIPMVGLQSICRVAFSMLILHFLGSVFPFFVYRL